MTNGTNHTNTGRKRASNRKLAALILALALLAVGTAVGTIAYLMNHTGPVTNSFSLGNVDTEITEEFDGRVKRHVNVTNTGTVTAYIRVKLVSYRVNDRNEIIGGSDPLTDLPRLGDDWKPYGDHYYYTKPVAPGAKPATNLFEEYALEGNYTDADGGKQVLEVMAEGIQSTPAQAVKDAWGIEVDNDGTLKL